MTTPQAASRHPIFRCPATTRKNAESTRRSKTHAPSSLAVSGALQDKPEKRRERCAHSRKCLEYIKKADSAGHRRKRKEYIQKCKGRGAQTRTQRVAGKTPKARGEAASRDFIFRCPRSIRKNAESARRSKTHAPLLPRGY